MAAVNAPLGQLVELVGLSAALRLVDRFGGTPIYLPHPSRVKEHSAVALEIGAEAMRRLAAVWPQAHIVVPRGAAYLRRQRDIALLRDSASLSAAQLARKYEMIERHVYRILARGPEILPELGANDDGQGDLFGTV